MAQSPFLINYTTREGLPSNECYDLAQDKNGFVWVSSDRGVAKFDGAEFKFFSTREGLLEDIVTGLFVDKSNRVWCKTSKKGFSMIQDDVVHTPEWLSEMGTLTPRLEDLIEIDHDSILMTLHKTGGDESSFVIVDSNGQVSYESIPVDSGIVISHHSDGENDVFSYYNRPSSTVIHCFSNGQKLFHEVPKATSISDAAIDRHGTFHMASEKTLISLSADEYHEFHTEGDILNSLFVDRQNGLWVGTQQHGVYYFPNSDVTQKPQRLLTTRSVTAIIEDRERGIWFSTIEQGIFYMPYKNIQVIYTEDEFDDQRILRSVIHDSTIWVGFRNGLLARINPRDVGPGFEKVMDYHYIFSMQSLNDQLFVSIQKPRQNPVRRAGFTEINQCDDQIALSEKEYLRGVGGGLDYIKNDEVIPIPDLKHGDIPRVSAFAKDLSGRHWMGTYEGIYAFKDGKVERKNFGRGVDDQRIRRLIMYKEMGFAAVSGHGLLTFSPSDTLMINVESGLPSNYIQDMKVHDDKLWIATANGIAYLQLDSLAIDYQVLHGLNAEFVLPSTSVNALEFFGDSLWAMTDEGLSIIPLSILNSRPSAPDLFLNELRVNGKASSFDSLSKLNYTENNISMSYRAVSFANRSTLTYQYRVTGGRNAGWTTTRDESISLLELSPGNYQVELRAKVPSVEPGPISTVSFSIMPPLWLRWQFIVCALLVLFLLAIAFVNARIASIKREAQLQQEIVLLEHKALRSQMNPHFIYNALNAIQKFILQRDVEASINYLNSFSKLVRSIFESSGKDFVFIGRELDALRLYANLESARYPDRFDLEIDIVGDVEGIKIPPMIIQPYIENAILHGVLPRVERGRVSLTIQRHEKWLSIRVEDNGVGIQEGQRIKAEKQSFKPATSELDNDSGMRVTNARLHQLARKFGLDATFSVVDKSAGGSGESGTIVLFNIPFVLHL